MSDRNKNIKRLLTGFLRYNRGEMRGQERNAFEKELQKDPFTEEAAEGFESVNPKEAFSDMALLQKRLKSRTAQRKNFIYFRIAASVAVLVLISTVYLLVERDRPDKSLTDKSIQSVPIQIARNNPLKEPVVKNKASERSILKTENKPAKPADNMILSETSEVTGKDEESKVAAAPLRDSIPEIKVMAAEGYAETRKVAAPLAVMAKARSYGGTSVRGKVVSSEDRMPLPGVNVSIKGTNKGVVNDAGGNFNITIPDSDSRTLIADYIGMESKEFEAKADTQLTVSLVPSVSALSEVVVTGYGSVRTDSKKGAELTGYSAPQPVNGRSAFDKYIEKNLRRPDTLTSGQRVVVVIGFIVKTDGKIDSLRIVRSPGKPFSDEALRLIQSGPSWKPALENGKPIEDEVRLRIVFR